MPVFGKDNKVLSLIATVKNISRSIKTKAIQMIADKGIKAFSRILLTIREEEKKKISSVLHDEMGSLAVVLSSLLAILEADIKDNQVDNALDGLKKIRKYMENFIERIKGIAVNMRPPNLDTVGLSGALKDLIELVSKYTDVNVVFDCDIPENIRMDEHIRISLYRIAQESLNNILKHSGAKNATIHLETKKNAIYLTISDDGIGFEFDKNKSIKLKNIGILGMKENVEFLGGKFELKSVPGKGSKIFIMCPLASYVTSL
jgi:two-component system NarL family sensor kinase